MNSIDIAGFLSEDLSGLIEKNREENESIFSLVLDFNRFAQNLIREIEVHKENSYELLMATLYIRSLSIFQSTVILAERGLESETRILIRSLMEVMFALVACSKDKSVAERYLLNENVDTLKTIRRLKNYKGRIKGFTNVKKLLDREQYLNTEIGEKDIKNLSVEELSRLSGLHINYLIVYDTLSQTAHAKVKDLTQLIDFEKNIFKWGPRYSNIQYLLLTSLSYEIIIADSLIDTFKISGKTDKIKHYHDTTVELLNNIPNST